MKKTIHDIEKNDEKIKVNIENKLNQEDKENNEAVIEKNGKTEDDIVDGDKFIEEEEEKEKALRKKEDDERNEIVDYDEFMKNEENENKDENKDKAKQENDAVENGNTQVLKEAEKKPAVSRADVLRKRLVAPYRAKQEQKEVKAKAPGTFKVILGKATKIAGKVDYASDLANMGISTLSTGVSEASGLYTMEKKSKDSSFTGDGVTEGLNYASGVMEGASLLKNTGSLFTKGIKGFASGVGAVTTKSKRKRRTGWINTASSAMGMGAAGTGMAKNVIGMGKSFGGWKLQDATGQSNTLGQVNQALGAVSAGFGLLGAIGGLGSGIWEKKMFKDTAKKAAGFAGRDEDENLASEDRAIRRNAKAHKYAMGQAQAFNKMKSEQSLKGIGGMVAAVMGAGASAGGYLFGKSTAWKMLVAPVLGIGSALAKGVGAKSDKEKTEKAAKDSTALKIKTVKDYIKDKKGKIQTQYEALAGNDDLDQNEKAFIVDDNNAAIPLSEQMKEKIVLARLGANVDLGSDEEPGNDVYLEAFTKINLKRARYIMEASDKADMLQALGLDADAGIEDVAQALIGE